MGGQGIQHLQEGLYGLFRVGRFFHQLIEENHQLRNHRIEVQAIDVVGDLLDRFVQQFIQLLVALRFVGQLFVQRSVFIDNLFPETSQES